MARPRLRSAFTRRACRPRSSFQTPARLPEPVELAAYFVACEALANVAKYARATGRRSRVSRRNGVAVVEIADDGVGGADETAGTASRGWPTVSPRWTARCRILSPPGEGTVVTAELPCAS